MVFAPRSVIHGMPVLSDSLETFVHALTHAGSDSIYGGLFKDEFHSRLKFSHRGLLAAANQNQPDTNGSQFFITLDETSFLEKKNTIFGKVTVTFITYEKWGWR